MAKRRAVVTIGTLGLERASSVPLYRQLYDALRDAILSGRLRPGSRLPSTRALADDLGASRNTVLAAFGQLLAEGYLEGRVGAGTTVARTLPETLLPARPEVEGTKQPSRRPRLSRRGRRDPLDKCQHGLGGGARDEAGPHVNERVVVNPAGHGQPPPGEVDVQFVGFDENERVSRLRLPQRFEGGVQVLRTEVDALGPGVQDERLFNRGRVMDGGALCRQNHIRPGGIELEEQAAEAGVIGICWTNTLANLPPWGASTARIGNNPLVIAVPRNDGPDGHVVLDMALSQFSYGALASYRTRGELLPVPGGFDNNGELTRDPATIEATRRPLPIGFWKGSGLSIVLDMIAATLSGGRATHEVPANPEQETGLSQVFLAFDASSVSAPGEAARVVDAILASLHLPSDSGERIRYPGQRTMETRKRSMRDGVEVDPSVWQLVQSLSSL
jgi:DNA-binding transcriptional regulator YhcF (GntR family)